MPGSRLGIRACQARVGEGKGEGEGESNTTAIKIKIDENTLVEPKYIPSPPRDRLAVHEVKNLSHSVSFSSWRKLRDWSSTRVTKGNSSTGSELMPSPVRGVLRSDFSSRKSLGITWSK